MEPRSGRPRPLDRPRRGLLALVVSGALTLGACGSDDDGERATEADLAQGAGHFAESCAACHGGDLRGTDQGPSLLSRIYEPGHHSDDAFRAAVRRGSPAHHWGFGDMPPIEGLDDEEVDVIIAFIREQQDTHGFEP
jgi:mono/diheme cytochrome c family protein